MASPLERLAGPGQPLTAEPPGAKEFAGLKRSGSAYLRDAGNSANSLDSRFVLAYSAAHALCLAALRHHGFRARTRYIVFQVLPHTLGLGPEVWRVLAKGHDTRNLGEYEGDLNVDERCGSGYRLQGGRGETRKPARVTRVGPGTLPEGSRMRLSPDTDAGN